MKIDILFKNRFGQTLIEVMIAMSLVAILVPALIGGLVISQQSKPQQKQRLQATTILQETKEAILSVREEGWTNFANNGTFHPAVNGADHSWDLIGGEEPMSSGFTRSVVISDVLRDSAGAIVLTGGSYTDPSTKQAVITVSWELPKPSSITSTLYITRHDNLSYTQTLQATFEAGLKTNTFVTNNSGGEVTLGAGGGGGDWCIPTQSITTVDLSRQGVPTAISAMNQNGLNSIVTGTGGNASGPTFSLITATGNNPVTAQWRGEYDNSKANGVYRDSNNFAYIANTDHGEEIKILDLAQYSDPPTNTKFAKVGWFNAPGNKDGQAVFVLGTVGYMASDNKFYTFDLTGTSNSRPRYGTFDITLAGNGKKIIVQQIGAEKYAFIALDSTTYQMEVYRVTDPANPVKVAWVQTGNGKAGVDISINGNGTRVYLVTAYAGGGLKDFFVINSSSLSGTLPLKGAGYDTGGMSPKGVAVATGNRAIIVGTGGAKQYMVLNMENEDLPTTCGTGLAITGGANGITTVVDGDYAYAYVVSADSHAELKIILGGAGGQYTASGIFESLAYNNSTTTAFNSFTAHVSQPESTLIKLRVGVANADNNGSCTGVAYNYLGPGGSTTEDFLIGADQTVIRGSVPIATNGTYVNPGRCFRYKAWLSTTETTASPVLYDFTVNYAP